MGCGVVAPGLLALAIASAGRSWGKWAPMLRVEGLRRGVKYNESEQNQSCPGDGHLSDGIGSNESHLEKETLKDDNEVNREESNGFTSAGRAADPPLPGYEQGPPAYTDMECCTNGNQNNGGHGQSLDSFSFFHFEKIGEETEFYMDKALTEIEPKMIVCYKEGSSQSVKDICIDQGIHSFVKHLVEYVADNERFHSISQIDSDECTKDIYISDALKVSSLKGQSISDVKEDVKQDSSGNLLEEYQDISDIFNGAVSTESREKRINERLCPRQNSDMQQFQRCTTDGHHENLEESSLVSLLDEDINESDIAGEIVHAYETKGLPPTQKFDSLLCRFALTSLGTNLSQPYLIENDADQPQSISSDSEQQQCTEVGSHRLECVTCDGIKPPSTVGNSDQIHSVHDGISEEKVNKCALEVSNSTTSSVSSEDPKVGNEAKSLFIDGKSGSNTITFGFDSELPATSLNKDANGVSEFHPSGLLLCGTSLADASIDGPGTSVQTSRNYIRHLDSNFLGLTSFSARMAYMAHIPYSGSMSLRSEGSATSTRSFAFPILQSEWNSSPERMAKADRRHLKKHRFWRFGFPCCRF